MPAEDATPLMEPNFMDATDFLRVATPRRDMTEKDTGATRLTPCDDMDSAPTATSGSCHVVSNMKLDPFVDPWFGTAILMVHSDVSDTSLVDQRRQNV